MSHERRLFNVKQQAMFAMTCLQRLNRALGVTADTLRGEEERRLQREENTPHGSTEEQNPWRVSTRQTQSKPPAFAPEVRKAAWAAPAPPLSKKSCQLVLLIFSYRVWGLFYTLSNFLSSY